MAKYKKPHTKYINKDGIQVPGVTTVTGVLNKPYLPKWANNIGLQGINITEYVDALADAGTLAHYMVLCHLENKKPYLDDYSKNTTDLATNSFKSYLEWEENHTIKPILIEQPLVSDIYNYGGTPDFIGYIDDCLEIVDLKTGKAIYDDYFLQVAGYNQLAIEAGHKATRFRIIRIGREASEGFVERVVKQLDLEFQVFCHCLHIHELQKELKRG